ncbi:MAG: RdgB/HAM1 family non-canonical purine NTP pyrophosphatase [Sandaracinus sp.]|nr:RdgB/HAM1 family non-canonical purine NTP pyrophosphatase [Myxococcales bacterium]MCB9602026.1 RdgB/HAM1 family non-canonical purine NTP pyrophosphatase [Sandaracinus sp.]MCB9615208.1 RdgB/HAM1 family non-canonical purine NTP pyrophosphatase [Sandaracinus sp.]
MSAPIGRVVLASANRKKLKELREVLADMPFELVGPEDLGGEVLEVEETEETFVGNARLKAVAYAKHFGVAALADDSGLEVDALDGAPGVYSARYAGEGAGDAANLDKLLKVLDGRENRDARFRCVLVLVDAQGEPIADADGTCEGRLLEARRGEGGFGYDPIFLPEGETHTMAELTPEQKHRISHRGRAAKALAAKLR